MILGGNRNWVQVLCNGGPATFLALVYILDCGAGESPIDFDTNYHASWLSTSILGIFFLTISLFELQITCSFNC